MRLIADEVFHPLVKIQPLLIGLNLPDQVDSSLTGVILPIARLEYGFVRRGGVRSELSVSPLTTISTVKLVSAETLHPIGKAQPLQVAA